MWLKNKAVSYKKIPCKVLVITGLKITTFRKDYVTHILLQKMYIEILETI